jgi:glycyl-tRNA synthetase beta subunit
VEGAADFVLEIGTEELPPAEVASAIEQLQERVEAMLTDLSLQHGGVNVQGTPRRLAVQIAGLAAVQDVTTEERRGPPRKRAYGDDGQPTKALVGFCKSSGAELDAVYFQADKKVCSASAGACGAQQQAHAAMHYMISHIQPIHDAFTELCWISLPSMQIFLHILCYTTVRKKVTFKAPLLC